MRGACIAVAIAFFLVAGSTAAADTYTTVNMDRNGPDRDLPLRSSFYLSGSTSADVQAVRAVFVRYAWHAWVYPFKSPNCQQVISNLAIRSDAPLFNETEGSIRAPSDLWNVKRGILGDSDDIVYTPAPWKRDPSGKDDQPYKVLVSEPGFFKAGAQYCLFIYEQRPFRSTELSDPLKAYADGTMRCLRQLGGNLLTCQSGPLNTLGGALSKLVGNLSPRAQNDVRQYVTDKLADQQLKITAIGDRLDAAFDLLDAWIKSPAKLTGLVDGHTLVDIDYDPFARAMVLLLARSNQLGQDFASGKFYSLRQTPEPVEQVGLTPDLRQIRFTSEDSSGRQRPVKTSDVDLTKALIPESSGSLINLVRLAQGQLLSGFETSSFRPGRPTFARTEIDKNQLKAIRDGAQAALSVLSAIDQMNDSLGTDLKSWVNEMTSTCVSVKGSAAAFKLTTFTNIKIVCTGAGIDFANVDSSPLKILIQLIDEYTAALSAFEATITDAQKKAKAPQIANELPVRVQMTQKDYITSYVTPVVGYGHLIGKGASVADFGVQLYLFPDPVEEPMWSNGATDWRRLLSLELAVGLKTGPFGPQNRYSGAEGLPPVFLGLALQPVPYVTVSLGEAVVGHRSTPLPQEHPTTKYLPYVGLAVQGNVPDIIRNISTSGSASTTSSAAK